MDNNILAVVDRKEGAKRKMQDLDRSTLPIGFALEAAHKGKAAPYTAEKIKELYNQNKRDYIESYFKIYVHHGFLSVGFLGRLFGA